VTSTAQRSGARVPRDPRVRIAPARAPPIAPSVFPAPRSAATAGPAPGNRPRRAADPG
jgi:hypothetical protein